MHNLDDDNNNNKNDNDNDNDNNDGGERASAVNHCRRLCPQQQHIEGAAMLMMPTATQDDGSRLGRKNSNQQTMGAKVMAMMGDDDAGGEGWMTPPKTPLWLPLL
jgi:hypothetical protein